MTTAVSLTGSGFFPRELPPAFRSVPLADLLEADPHSLKLDGPVTECSRHNLARLGGFRRPLKVPNPRSYIKLGNTLEDVWSLIDAHLSTRQLAISRPVATPEGERALRPRVHIREQPRIRARLWRGQRWVLRGDVSQFYSSLYTHAIPWALHTKKVAKARKGKTVGDRIDKAVRDCSSGQTVGIPIGPDASFAVAEIVLTAVDAAFECRLPGLRAFRYLDDYEAAFQTRAEADEAQAHLETALGEYELVVNPFKTYVIELPQPFKTTWTHELQAFPIRNGSSTKTINDTIALFSRASEVAIRHPGALAYALRKSREVPVDAAAWPTFQSLVWSAVSVEPTTMAVALDLLTVKALEADLPVRKRGASDVLESMLKRNASLRNASEVAWAVWAAIQLEVDLSSEAATAVSGMEDDFVALLALDANSRGRFPANALDSAMWESLVDHDEVLSGDHWLLAYEGALQGWIGSSRARVAADPFFAVLLKKKIKFYDSNPARDPFTGPAGPLAGGPDSYGGTAGVTGLPL